MREPLWMIPGSMMSPAPAMKKVDRLDWDRVAAGVSPGKRAKDAKPTKPVPEPRPGVPRVF